MNPETKNGSLISIVVVTYNSADYVIETLESILNQTYLNKELIITDDSSTDNTIELCDSWLRKHCSDFVSSVLVQSETNTGPAGNCNRGLEKAKGEWIKLIAGDDILLSNCLTDNYEHCSKHP